MADKTMIERARSGELSLLDACEYALTQANADARDGGMCLRCGSTYHYGDTVHIHHLPDCGVAVVEAAVKRARGT